MIVSQMCLGHASKEPAIQRLGIQKGIRMFQLSAAFSAAKAAGMPPGLVPPP